MRSHLKNKLRRKPQYPNAVGNPRPSGRGGCQVLNGYRFTYDEEIRTILKRFGTDERTVGEADVGEYLHTHTEELDLAGEIERWREDLLQYGLKQLTGDSGDQKD
ncbi:hypothetical protein Hbl1158_03070 [Halobaculum sp. CBA1158]|uniref:hypothetical protein n=1 Tax=Halobaculum sp. CBA1158 TaxID=2904243 RepID=UPI001F3F7272|nr:hypothetical protein [Halobaculum sp. CBA1158]UIP00367.1 hypothetical protein Hbl1158_03070 [Halobaculum sp. CBA1158]